MNLQFRTEYCTLNGYDPTPVDHKYVNLYVKLTSVCMARCSFCTFCSGITHFNLNKFQRTIDAILSDGIVINKISFTGGEPTLRHIRLALCVKYIKKVSPETFIVVNTNGIYLSQIPDEVDSISMSRHHYDDRINYSIFDSKILPSRIGIELFKHREKIHLSCSLIKGYIDSKEEIYNYLEHAAELGVYDVGFVGLMPVNNYAKEHFVDIEKINLSSDRLIKNKEWHYKDSCRCNNYLYMPKKGDKLVKFYARHRCKYTTDIGSNAVFDGQNLLTNFGGEIIY